jgi:Flp pilus assembly protein TadG
VAVFRRRDEGGATAVEFALVLVPMLVIVFGLIQYGFYFYSAQTGSNTVNASARQLSVGNCQAAGALQSFVDGRLGAASTGPAVVEPEFINVDGTEAASLADATIGGTLTLTIEFSTIDLNFPFVPFLNDAKVSRTVQARIEDTTDQGCGA